MKGQLFPAPFACRKLFARTKCIPNFKLKLKLRKGDSGVGVAQPSMWALNTEGAEKRIETCIRFACEVFKLILWLLAFFNYF